MESQKSRIAGSVEGSSSTPARLPMERVEFGESGRPGRLLTNYFKVLMKLTKKTDDAYFYLYDVSLTHNNKYRDAVKAKDLGREVMDKVGKTRSADIGGVPFAYDGDKLVTVKSLPGQDFEFEVGLEDASSNRGSTAHKVGGETESDPKRAKLPNQSETFKVKINYKSKFRMDSIARAANRRPSELPQDAFRVLDIILRQQAAKNDRFMVGQSFFKKPEALDLTGTINAFVVFRPSFRGTQGGLFLNIDASHTLITQSKSVINFLLDDQKLKDQDKHRIDWEKAKRMLTNLRVKIRGTKEERRIRGFSKNSCKDQTFLIKPKNEGSDGSGSGTKVTITVYDYFVERKEIDLDPQNGDLRCVDVGKSSKHPVYFPLELCDLVSLQHCSKALSTDQRSVLEKSRLKPNERVQLLKKEMESDHYHNIPMLHDTGFSIKTDLTKVEGRTLPAPKLEAGKPGEPIFPHKGKWNLYNQTLAQPAKIEDWIAVNFSSGYDVEKLVNALTDCAKKKGLSMGSPPVIFYERREHRKETASKRVEEMFRKVEKRKTRKTIEGLAFILCVLPQKKNCDIYGPWKRKCLADYGVPTQCIAPQTKDKMDDQHLTNVVLKINAKIGGLNFFLNKEYCSSLDLISTIPTLILGMDVCHGPPGQPDMKSIAAVVSSVNWPSFSYYRAAVRTQSPKCEKIESGDSIIKTALRNFEKTSKRRPDQIIIFRDGVGESQFKDVLNDELENIIKACKVEYGQYRPKFTVIVAQKRHHARFFKDDDSLENVEPGMIVDKTICHPKNNDFYLCAHKGIMGTSRPVHYHVLLDEIRFDADDLQKLVHSFCYILQRSTAAASVVAPICYAHLAAAQVAEMMKADDSSNSSSRRDASMSKASSSSHDASESKAPSSSHHASESKALYFPRRICESMFFC